MWKKPLIVYTQWSTTVYEAYLKMQGHLFPFEANYHIHFPLWTQKSIPCFSSHWYVLKHRMGMPSLDISNKLFYSSKSHFWLIRIRWRLTKTVYTWALIIIISYSCINTKDISQLPQIFVASPKIDFFFPCEISTMHDASLSSGLDASLKMKDCSWLFI